MIDLSKLYQIAKDEEIEVDCFEFEKRESLSVMDDDGICYIAIDPFKLKSTDDERLKLAHELGHCITGSFYNIHATVDCRRKHENTANKWAIQNLIPVDELDAAVADGYTELWELAERFGVTEDFMKQAICLYTYGNVASDVYF